jgi:hypothetical protein
MALRTRKNTLIASLRFKARVHGFTPAQVAKFEALYRAARSEAEQDEVTRAVDHQVFGWKTDTDAFSRVLQAASNIGELADEDEDEDPPSLKEGLARSTWR